MGCPLVPAATRLREVQSGQSGQPRPEALSRTAAPVMMIPALAATPARATRRMVTSPGVERGLGPARQAAQPGGPGRGAGGAARLVATWAEIGWHGPSL